MPGTIIAIAEYVVTDNKSVLFLITKDAAKKVSLKTFTIDLANKDLAKRVDLYRTKLAAGDLDFQKASRELYDVLLKPAEALLKGKTNLIVVPDGPLWDLPFQTLQNAKGQYMVEQSAISYAPSLTALKEMTKKARARKPDANMELLAFGNPIVGKETTDRVQRVFMNEKLEPLPEAERLVTGLSKMYGTARSKVFVGNAAREEVAKTEAPKYRIVQFATHGILNNVSPMYSHLVLAQGEKNPNEDGLLEAWEMKDLDLKADMVVLSACDTARGRISSGEGVIGMSWALFIAGTPTTVASQWKVESTSTTDLMLEFHRQLLTGKVTKAEALRQASLKLLHNPAYRHPSYWGAWVLVGDGH
jgi:CHAT domain-containing protein